MTKITLIQQVAEDVGVSRREAGVYVEAVLDNLREALGSGEEVKIREFGTFICKERKGRIGRNPNTGEPLEIPAKRVILFRPAQNVLDQLNE